MPLDIPRDPNGDGDGDGDWIDQQGYQAMHVLMANAEEEDEEDEGADDEGDEDESDFEFSSDEEGDPARREETDGTEEADRYAHYQPIRQQADDAMNGHNGGGSAAEPSGAEEDAEANQAENVFYQHNYVVQWITTDQPLFDREQFAARQAASTATNAETAVPHSTDSSTSTNTDTSGSRSSENPTAESNQPDSSDIATVVLQPGSSASSVAGEQRMEEGQPMDKEKIDVIKGLMSGFKLPEESVPSWAKDIPEDQWKTFINKKMDG